VAATTLIFKPDELLLARFDGFGAQYNQNLFAERSRDAGVTEAGVNTMTPKLAALGPQMARLFFHHDALANDDLLTSFRRSVALAQATVADGGAINITLQALGSKVLEDHPNLIQQFADELVHLVQEAGVDKLRWVTLRNEPNGSSPMDKDLYAQVYRELDAELTRAGVRPQVRFMGGDLLLPGQQAWFDFMAANLADLLDAYSIHVYWDYRHPTKIDERLRGVRQIVNGLGAAKRPLYVMEYGARGIMDAGEEEPGHTADGRAVAETNENAFQRAWFALESVKQGFRGTASWDAYFAKYDRNELMHYSLIGPPPDWDRRPAFRALRLLIQAVRPGWKGVNVRGVSDTQRVVGFTGAGSNLTIAGLDTAGAELHGASSQQASYVIQGVPANTSFRLWFWNHEGDGMNSFDGSAQSDGQGRVSIQAPLQSLFVLTTLPRP
jgi:hypothetical protein